jgi:hypothetical protein
MAISLTTLYNRLGKLFGVAKSQIDARSALLDRIKGTGSYTGSGLDGQYDSSTRYMISDVLAYFLNLYSSTDSSISNVVQGGVKTLTEMVTADNDSIAKTTNAALQELNRQMRSAGTSLYKNVVTQGSVSYSGSNVGTGKVILHSIPSQMSASETIRVQCISDTTTGAALGREVFRITGTARVSDSTSYLWPGGSGCNATLASSDYNDSKNTLQNGGFDTFTGGVPDGWTVLTGAASLSQLSSGTFRNGSALQHSGSVAGTISQTSAQVVLGPNKRIVFGFWAKRVSGTQTRDIAIALATPTGDLVEQDAAALTTSWALNVFSYTMPFDAPATNVTVELRFDQDVGCVKAIDCAFVFVPSQYGVNGQFIQIIGGATDWRIGDYATVAITNNYQSNVLNYTERFFAPFASGIELPTDATGTVTNSVIP